MRATLLNPMVLAAALLFSLPTVSRGQQLPFFEGDADPVLWGVSGSFTDMWVAPKEYRWLIGAETLDLSGSDYRIGFVRGSLLGGEWGLSYVHQTVDPGSEIGLSRSFPEDITIRNCEPAAFAAGDCGVFYETNAGLRLRGFELHRFIPFVTFSERVQVGMNIAGGGGWYRGTASRRAVNRSPASDLPGEFVGESMVDVMGSELTLPRRFDTPVPILNIDIAVAGIVAGGLKIRGGMGVYGFPGRRRIVASATYLFGAQ